MSDGYKLNIAPMPPRLTGLEVRFRANEPHHIEQFHVQHYDVTADDADGYSTLSTKDLPPTLTAHELAQIIDMTIRAPNYVIRRDFAGVAHLFKAEGRAGEEGMMRKVVQIAAESGWHFLDANTSTRHITPNATVVLCDDGTVWRLVHPCAGQPARPWERYPSIPQDGDAP